MTVRLPSASRVNARVTLANIDTVAMEMPAYVIIPQGQSSATFEVIVASTGCVRIKATNTITDGTVTNAFRVTR
jgi:hypothetical protein